MEPPPFGDGNLPRSMESNRAELPGPSMEPPPFGDGNADHGAVRRPPTVPSMEPPPFGDGNSLAIREIRRRSGPFNGATALRRWKQVHLHDRVVERTPWDLQWSHRPSAMETEVASKCLQWSHRPSAMETTLRQSLHSPSMEPPPFGDGNITGVDRTSRLQWSQRLQWSHRPSAMETLQWRPPFGDGGSAAAWTFNGATALRRWKRGGLPASVRQDRMDLQWSHRPSAMETRGTSGGSAAAWTLQWSHRPSAMET